MKNNNDKDSITIREFYEMFPDDESCLQHVFDCRFGVNHACPKCAKKSKWSRMTATRAFACQWCGHHIHPTAGTPFEDTRTPLQLWFYAIYLFTTSRHGVPAKELQRKLGVTYKTAWRMGHHIRQHMADVDGENKLSGEVEIDETIVGGVRHSGKPGRNMANKTVVFGMLQRGGEVMTKVVKNAKRKTLLPIIRKNVEEGTTIHTDEHVGYAPLVYCGYDHQKVNHSQKEYVRGNCHVNGLENFWKHLKGSIKSTHIHVSKKYLGKYAKEFEFRFNRRNDPISMFPTLVSTYR